MRLRPRRVHTRLTLWYVVMFGAVLLIYMACATLLQYWQLRAELYDAEVQDVETAEGLLYFNPNGSLSMHENYHNRPDSLLLLNRMMEVLSPDGTVLYRNARLGDRNLGEKVSANEGKNGYDQRSLRLSDGTQVLLISHLHYLDQRPLLIRLAYSVVPLQDRMEELIGLLLLAVPFALAAAGFAASKVTHQALVPLEDIARRTEQITANRLHDRLPVENPDDELGHITRVLNGLLARLESSFEQLRRFTSDASHELRTPLAALRSVGETGLQYEHTKEEYKDIIGSMLEEVTRLTHMVDSLLTISRADSGELRLQLSAFSMLSLVREAAALVDVLAEEKEQILTLAASGDVLVRADRLFLRQAVVNVLHNAVKYSPVGGTVKISLSTANESAHDNWAILEIEDNGPGIREEERGKVFDRFYRIDEGRSREAGGAGLGLAIAKWAVEMHGGTIGVKSAASEGACFFIRIRT